MSVLDTAVTSRVRLARNVRGVVFPMASAGGYTEELLDVMKKAELAAKGLFDYDFFFMASLSDKRKLSFIERHFISPDLAENSRTGGLVLSKDGSFSVMLNEEDHIRAQCIEQGFNLKDAYERINAYDDRLLKALPIAFDKQLGFLTACPTNVGTGMRASVMLFLPALKRTGIMDSTLLKIAKYEGLTFRGIYGEGSEPIADMYQLSNSRTLGLSESDIIAYVERAAIEIIKLEEKARASLKIDENYYLRDEICRAYGVLKNAYMLSSKDLYSLIAKVKLGIILNVLPKYDLTKLDKMVVMSGAATLSGDRELNELERDILRAGFVRQILNKENV